MKISDSDLNMAYIITNKSEVSKIAENACGKSAVSILE
jgi:hypothetical protein